MASTGSLANLHRIVDQGRPDIGDWSTNQVAQWVTTIVAVIAASAFCESTAVSLKPWLDSAIDVMALIAVHVESENCQPSLAFDTLAGLERIFAVLTKYYARIAKVLYECDLSPSLIVHQGYVLTTRVASHAMPYGLAKIIGDRLFSLSPLTAINTTIDILDTATLLMKRLHHC